ncbi:beta-ketoacyl synthase N-terminal-like domain-containing protein [Streptomyces zagrosensis]|uniref:Beta-ketoacyl synthase-like N-terminal domain-containing protein n=1 Tax=Streptomyces zagrosensis TaxID=1042984 RepID=A0A7W9QH19_9ACTN|nr:beta-ketoacyl synthase N-terminal-like domain-containing protein [Streptomyces zagrosensis]MBB5940151.1 hypothetical protein [Streptomyces zagrosensis]
MNAYITGIGMVAPGVRTLADLDASQAPDEVAADWFDPVPLLGKRGWKYFTPATRYLLAAANEAQGTRHGDAPPEGHAAERVAVVTGTHHGISALHQRLDHIAREEGPSGLSPAELPGFSVNMPASQLAISLRCRAFSVTLTNPVVAGLEAVLFAASALGAGRAERVLATATEEAPAPAVAAARATEAGRTLSGAAALTLDARADAGPGGRAPLGEVTGGTSRFVPVAADGSWQPRALEAAARRLTALVADGASGAGAVGVPPLRYAFCGPACAAPADEALRKALVGSGGPMVEQAPSLGADARYGTVSGILRLAQLLRSPGPWLLIAASADGHLTAVRGNSSFPNTHA